MGMVRGKYKFERPAPELEAVRAELEAIAGLPVLLTEEPYTDEHGKKVGSSFYLAFRDVPKERLQIERGMMRFRTVRSNSTRRDWDDWSTEIDETYIVFKTYIGCELTLMDYAAAALEKLGGKEITSTPNAEPLPLPSTPIEIAELKRRQRKNYFAMLPLAIASVCIVLPMFVTIILIAKLFEWVDRARGRSS
jgi:hypothetical protein